MKILIVDDDPAILKITSRLLQLEGHEVECCENALDAIQAIADLSHDILITDATMPAYSGFDLVRSVRKREEFNYLSIAMLTGRKEKSDIEQAVELGVQDYIVKPIEPMVFLSKIEKLIERHKKKKIKKPEVKHGNCEMSVPVQLVRITDVGVSIETPYALNKGSVVKLKVPELEQAGISQNQFKALYSSPSKNNHMVIEMVLMNLSPNEQKNLLQLSKANNKKRTA